MCLFYLEDRQVYAPNHREDYVFPLLEPAVQMIQSSISNPKPFIYLKIPWSISQVQKVLITKCHNNTCYFHPLNLQQL